jgi:hypothetical protein
MASSPNFFLKCLSYLSFRRHSNIKISQIRKIPLPSVRAFVLVSGVQDFPPEGKKSQNSIQTLTIFEGTRSTEGGKVRKSVSTAYTGPPLPSLCYPLSLHSQDSFSDRRGQGRDMGKTLVFSARARSPGFWFLSGPGGGDIPTVGGEQLHSVRVVENGRMGWRVSPLENSTRPAEHRSLLTQKAHPDVGS